MKFSLRALAPLFLFFLTACSFSLAEDITPPPGSQVTSAPRSGAEPVSGRLYPLVPPNPENGAPIYLEKCAPCHGDAGMGDGPRADQLPNPVAPLGSADFARQSTPAHWYTVVTQGNLERFMPPFNSLSDRQRWDVVAYSFSLSISPAALQQGQELYQDYCAGCHGAEGQGDGPDAAGLSRPPSNFTNQALMAEKTSADLYQALTAGVAPDMPAFGGLLSEKERWALADYLRMLTFLPSGEPSAVAAATETVLTTQDASQLQESGTQAALAEPGSTQPALSEASGTQDASGVPTAAGTQVSSAASAAVTIHGQVSNGSGGELPADLVVTLHGFDEMQSVITDTTRVQPDGSYTFENIETAPGRSFLVAVQYGNATYGSDVAVVEPEMQTIDLPVIVYDTTTDSSVLVGDRLHLFFEFTGEQTVRVIELYILSNTSGKTLVSEGEGQPTVTFKLPEGATNLEFQDGSLGQRYVETEDGFGDTVPVRPGQETYQALFAFQMPYDRKLELVQPVSVPVNGVVILIPEGSMKIQSDMLQDAGVQDVQGTQYRAYNGSPLSAGQDLRLTLTGRPGSGSPTLGVGSSTNLVIGLGAFGLALVLSGIWLYTRTRSRAADGDPEEAWPEDDSLENAETVMDAILALDDLYKAGELPEEAYHQRRGELKARLQALME